MSRSHELCPIVAPAFVGEMLVSCCRCLLLLQFTVWWHGKQHVHIAASTTPKISVASVYHRGPMKQQEPLMRRVGSFDMNPCSNGALAASTLRNWSELLPASCKSECTDPGKWWLPALRLENARLQVLKRRAVAAEVRWVLVGAFHTQYNMLSMAMASLRQSPLKSSSSRPSSLGGLLRSWADEEGRGSARPATRAGPAGGAPGSRLT